MQVSISIEPYLKGDKQILRNYIEEIIHLSKKVSNVSIHFDYFSEDKNILELVRGYSNQIDIYVHIMTGDIDRSGFKAVARNIDGSGNYEYDLVFDLGQDLSGYDGKLLNSHYATVMTVKCGKSGQVFNESAIPLIGKIKQINPNIIVTVDGGINENNINLVKNAGADIVVVGNYAKKCYENGNFEKGVNTLLRV